MARVPIKMDNNVVQGARLGSPSCVIQEVSDGHEEQQTGFGSPVDTAMHTGFGSPINTESAPPHVDYVTVTYMPISGSPFGGAAGVASDNQFAADSMTHELLAASTAAASSDAQLGPNAQRASPAGISLLPLHLLSYAVNLLAACTSLACAGQCHWKHYLHEWEANV